MYGVAMTSSRLQPRRNQDTMESGEREGERWRERRRELAREVEIEGKLARGKGTSGGRFKSLCVIYVLRSCSGIVSNIVKRVALEQRWCDLRGIGVDFAQRAFGGGEERGVWKRL